MDNPTFRLQLDNDVTVVFTLEVTGQPDQASLDEIVRSAEAALIQWSLKLHNVRRSSRLLMIGKIADTLEARFNATVTHSICLAPNPGEGHWQSCIKGATELLRGVR